MEKGSKTTATAAALLRAGHLYLDDDPKIFEDPYALPFSGLSDEAALRAAVEEMQSRVAHLPGSAVFRGGTILARQRFAEQCLEQAQRDGVDQYLVLGAGLDSFAFRHPELANRLAVFEVDFPATQRAKQAQLAELGLSTPTNLTFVPVDFETDDLRAKLVEHGLDFDRPVFVSWLGVTMFLTDGALFDTFAMITSMASGSQIVFDYFVTAAELADGPRQQLEHLQTFAEQRGEPFESLFVPDELDKRLYDVGFSAVIDLDPAQISDRYFRGRTDGLVAADHAHLIHATV